MFSPSAFARIQRAGFDLEILRADTGYLVHLTYQGRRIFTERAPRVGRLTIEEVRQKCRDGKWRTGSKMLNLLDRLASLCEGLKAAVQRAEVTE